MSKKLKQRCPRCLDWHYELRYTGLISGDREFFCEPQCQHDYFYDFLNQRDIGGKWDG